MKQKVMNIWKKNLVLLCGSIMFAAAAGCSYLDVVPDDTATLGDAFKNESTTEAFLFSCYSYQYDWRNWRGYAGRLSTDELAMEARWGIEWFPVRKYNEGVMGSSSGFGTGMYDMKDIWIDMYQGILQCHIFLENIDGVPNTQISAERFAAMKEEWKGEATFLLAYYHQILFNTFGPCVLRTSRSTDPLPRSSVKDIVVQLSEWYDYAYSKLPDRRDRADYGRVDKMIALAYKARLLLYAASPLYNGDPEGVWTELGAPQGFTSLINTTRDVQMWTNAKNAAKAAIDAAHAAGRQLYQWNGPDPVTGSVVSSTERKAYLSCRNVLIDSWNTEILWGQASGYASGTFSTRIENDEWARHTVPRGLGERKANNANPVGGISPTLAAVKIFYTKNGMPPENDPNLGYTWDETGRMTVPTGENTCNLHLNREQRFYAAIGYHGGVYEFNDWKEYTMDIFRGNGSADDQQKRQGLYINSGTVNETAIGNAVTNQDRLETGYAIKKDINPSGVATSSAFTAYQYVFPLMRLADLYLMYAEACAEATGSLDEDAKDYIRRIHTRAGLTDEPYYNSYTGTQLVDAVRRERMIELIFESHWHYDLRRWELADKWHNGRLWGNTGYDETNGMWGMNILGTDNATFFKEVQERGGLRIPYKFSKRMYLFPIYYDHVNKNPLLVQNPGYASE